MASTKKQIAAELLKDFHSQFEENQRSNRDTVIKLITAVLVVFGSYAYIIANTDPCSGCNETLMRTSLTVCDSVPSCAGNSSTNPKSADSTKLGFQGKVIGQHTDSTKRVKKCTPNRNEILTHSHSDTLQINGVITPPSSSNRQYFTRMHLFGAGFMVQVILLALIYFVCSMGFANRRDQSTAHKIRVAVGVNRIIKYPVKKVDSKQNKKWYNWLPNYFNGFFWLCIAMQIIYIVPLLYLFNYIILLIFLFPFASFWPYCSYFKRFKSELLDLKKDED